MLRCGFAPHMIGVCISTLPWLIRPLLRDDLLYSNCSFAATPYNANQSIRDYTLAFTYSATQHRPIYVCKDCAGFCMSLLTNTEFFQPVYTLTICRVEENQLTPASLVTALNSIPLRGERRYQIIQIFDAKHGQRESNPQLLVLETSALPFELCPHKSAAARPTIRRQ